MKFSPGFKQNRDFLPLTYFSNVEVSSSRHFSELIQIFLLNLDFSWVTPFYLFFIYLKFFSPMTVEGGGELLPPRARIETHLSTPLL